MCVGKAGKIEEGGCCHRRTLAIQEQALGVNPWDVARTLFNSRVCASLVKRAGEAEGYNRRALAIREKALGIDPRTWRAPCTASGSTLGMRAEGSRSQGVLPECSHDPGASSWRRSCKLYTHPAQSRGFTLVGRGGWRGPKGILFGIFGARSSFRSNRLASMIRTLQAPYTASGPALSTRSRIEKG